uniref:ATP synthase complex subunit 8 n=1 Tax=Branchinella kugenumaensis TaxID=381660 RepID=A0A7S8FJR0_9CRUS|nr:ATP synthase F0 subunit 8 [Branchinella kugenumaensis]QPD06971.1 ATP synthase F0 subunit 8 [Branchinella kugenumaensis]
MPQMAPLPWVSVILLCFFILILIMSITYFIYDPMPKSVSYGNISSKMMNWKW